MSCLYHIFFKTNKIYAINCEPCETKYSVFEYNMTCPVCREKFIWEKNGKRLRISHWTPM